MELGRVGIGGKESAMWMNVNSDTRKLKNIGRVGVRSQIGMYLNEQDKCS